jgi:protein-tyrosine phosphatase
MPWIEAQFSVIRGLVHHGVWLQLTAGSLTGRFGRRAQDWGVRLLDEGLCHLVATDEHDPSMRPPHLAKAKSIVEQRVGTIEAGHVFGIRAQAVVDNVSPAELPPAPALGKEPPIPSRFNIMARRLWGRTGVK